MARVLVYDAVAEESAEAPDPAKVERVRDWLSRNDLQQDLQVRYGSVAQDPGRRGRRQKRVDVQLAVDALVGASAGAYEVAVLVSGDQDFVPVAEEVKRSGRLFVVVSFASRLAQELRREADRVGYLPTDPNAWSWKLPK